MAPSSDSLRFLATTPRGLAELLAQELQALGLSVDRTTPTGVSFEGPLAHAYLASIHSRVANRVLLRLARAPATNQDELYQAAQTVTWVDHFAASDRFCVDFTGRGRWLNHSQYGALKVKDAVVDQFRDIAGARPDVDRQSPDVRIHAHLHRDWLELSIDLGAAALYRRRPLPEQRHAQDAPGRPGGSGAVAPMKENLAAAVLMRAGWPALARAGAPLLDPLCGSGTLLLEAALMAADIAPALQRQTGLSGWRGHDQVLWSQHLNTARQRALEGRGKLTSKFIGIDVSAGAIQSARAALASTGLADHCELKRGRLETLMQDELARAIGTPGLICANPPYGVRMGARDDTLAQLYQALGERMRRCFPGWRAAILCARSAPSSELRLSRARRYKLFNGPIECELICADLFSAADRQAARDRGPAVTAPPPTRDAAPPPPAARIRSGARDRAAAFANRVRKNLRHFGRWAARRGIGCYRVYDADLPEYALAVDLYQSDRLLVHAQEYAAPERVDPALARERLEDALSVLTETLELAPEQLFEKRRQRQRRNDQYQRLDHARRQHQVREGDARFLVNLGDFLDTGLFLDHRPMRALIAKEAQGKCFLNLFAYTATATVAAVTGGAIGSVSVDSSRVYCQWALDNLELNQAGAAHQVVQADCRSWLEHAARDRQAPKFDLAFLDPPTFSNSKSGRAIFDVQRDHAELVRAAMRALAPGGTLYFSTNKRRFRLDGSLTEQFTVHDITGTTIDEDFSRRPHVHQVYKIT